MQEAEDEWYRMVEGLVDMIVGGGLTPEVMKRCCGEDAVFGASPQLEKVRQAARSRLVSPMAVLGDVLARVSSEMPPFVALPPTIGSHASLNIAIALVGPSSAGKTTAHHCAGDLLTGGTARRIGPGTGEGIMQTFLRLDPNLKMNVLALDPRALLYADEIGQIGAVQQRSGASFSPIMRSMWSGAAVSSTNAEVTRNRHLDSHSYRLATVAGVQPRLSGILLDDADAGTPQRWLWMRATDPDMPEDPPVWPGSIDWTAPKFEEPPNDQPVIMKIPTEVTRLLQDEHRKRQRGLPEALDGHLLLTQLKAAALLALFHGDTDVSLLWWRVAGSIIDHSKSVRDECIDERRQQRDDESKVRGRSDAVRASAQRDQSATIIEDDAKKLARFVRRGSHPNAKHAADAGCTSRCVSYVIRNKQPSDREAAIQVAIERDWIVQRDERYFPGGSRPDDDT